ncbi:DJ-1/PfpI/YhbO family deglycase/protease [candidate division KSB1 bacterium]|nr:DJ-1/PfpI/YhbO family deglycase/protease [candidate division KSB1 bacterium]
MLNGKKIAILISPQFHDEEATIPRDYLHERGAQVDLVGLDAAELTGKYGRITLKPDKTIAHVRADEYDGLIIPGGGAPERIRINETALKFVRDFWASGRPLGAICHGPQVLISAGLLRGVTLTCYIGIRDDVQNVGATFVDQEVCLDGQLITSRTPDDLPAFNAAFARALAGDVVSDAEKELSPQEALQLAISREKGAQEFYLEMSGIVAEQAVRNKFAYLAAIEEGHFLQLSDLYQQITGGSTPVVDIKQNELGKHRVSPTITAAEAIDLGITAEEKAYEFYRFAASKANGKKVKELFEYLAAEELEHKRLFLVDKAVAQGGGHFQWATHFDIPPGMDDLW